MLTQYLSRLRAVLDRVVDAHADATYVWKPYEMLADVRTWLVSLLDLASEAGADPACGGTVLIYRGPSLVAQLVLRAPSHLLAFFPQHQTLASTGVRLPLELGQLEARLGAELRP